MIERTLSRYFKKRMMVQSAATMVRVQITGGDEYLAAKWSRIAVRRARMITTWDRLAVRLARLWRPVRVA